jgi:hypothetical protein
VWARGDFTKGLGICLIMIALCGAGCSGDDDGESAPEIRHPQDFLPPGTQGMVKDGNPRTASDTVGLQEIINGGYEDFTNNGFQEMVEQNYAGTVGGNQASIRVRIYDMGAAENTAALHVELTDEGPWQANDEIGDEEDRLRASSYQTILFRRGQYTSELVITDGSQDSMDLLILFATHIDQEITE